MVNLEKLYKRLSELEIEFFTGVPDSLLNDFCMYAVEHLDLQHNVIAANEGNAIGVAAGYYFATGKIPIVYMQNSGIGNAMNPLLSLAHKDVYSVPMLLIIGWRGDPAITDHCQHKRQGELTTILMDEMNIPYDILDSDETVIPKFEWAINKAKTIESPTALIVKKGILSKAKKDTFYPEEGSQMNREDAMDIVFDVMPYDTIYSATTGRATRELHEMFVKRNLPLGNEFLNVGSMGHCSSVALGMSVACPKRHHVCFDGDSSTIMHLGALTTITKIQPSKYLNIVLNNGAHESVGGEPSAGLLINLTSIAEAMGFNTIGKAVSTSTELKKAVETLMDKEGPGFIDVHIRLGIRGRIPKLEVNHKEIKKALMDTLSK